MSLAPPKKIDLVSAARNLQFGEWEVRRTPDGLKVEAVGDAEFMLAASSPIPPSNGTLRDYARKLVVQAAVALAARLTETEANQFVEHAPTGVSLYEREQHNLRSLRGKIANDVFAIVEHGDNGEDGKWRDGFDALYEVVKPRPVGDRHSGPAALFAEPPATGTLAPKAKIKTARSRKTSLATSAAPSRKALQRGLKYVLGDSMKLEIAVTTKYPLTIELLPARGFATRFKDCLDPPGSRDDRAIARSLVLQAIIDTLHRADMMAVRAWLSSAEADKLLNPDTAAEALEKFRAVLKTRLEQTIASTGHLGLERFADFAFESNEIWDL